MLVKVLKAFRFALDGITAKDAAVGAEVDIREADFAGLKAAGYVEAAEAEPTNSAPAGGAEPIDLDTMKRAELDAYAASLGLDTTEAANKAEAKDAIEAELARRAAGAELGTETESDQTV